MHNNILEGTCKSNRLIVYLMSFLYELVDLLRLVVQGDLEQQDAEHREAYDNKTHDKTAYYAAFILNKLPS